MTHKNDGFIENLMKVPAPLKVSKAIGIINHLKSICPQRVLFTLYNLSNHFSYALRYIIMGQIR